MHHSARVITPHYYYLQSQLTLPHLTSLDAIYQIFASAPLGATKRLFLRNFFTRAVILSKTCKETDSMCQISRVPLLNRVTPCLHWTRCERNTFSSTTAAAVAEIPLVCVWSRSVTVLLCTLKHLMLTKTIHNPCTCTHELKEDTYKDILGEMLAVTWPAAVY